MAEEITETGTAQTTSAVTETNTGAVQTGTGTQPVQTEAQTEKTFTQADVDRIVQERIKSGIKAGVKAELKKLTGEGDGTPTVDDLQRQLSEARKSISSYQAKDAIRDYLTDARHKFSIHSDDLLTIEELVTNRLEYDEEGKPTNLKEAIDSVKARSPKLFANIPGSIDANAGRNGHVVQGGMDARIRREAGFG